MNKYTGDSRWKDTDHLRSKDTNCPDILRGPLVKSQRLSFPPAGRQVRNHSEEGCWTSRIDSMPSQHDSREKDCGQTAMTELIWSHGSTYGFLSICDYLQKICDYLRLNCDIISV